MSANYILMLDIDTGLSLDELEPRLKEIKPLCLAWTTHSHLKTTTEIKVKEIERWARKNKVALELVDLFEPLKMYLLQRKNYHEAILDGATYEGQTEKEGVVYYAVRHEPMPKLRLLFLLEKPFLFPGGAWQKQCIKEWKRLVADVARRIGVPLDRSCIDPSRLMYTPRIPKGAEIRPGQHEIVLYGGACLDLENLDECLPYRPGTEPVPEPVNNSRMDKKTSRGAERDDEFDTKNLKRFAAIAASRFEFADFMVEKYGEECIRRVVAEGRLDFRCPNEDSHTDPSDDDTAFHVINASANDGSGFAAWCMHDGCIDEWEGDRLRVLDTVCQDLGIEDAMDLITPEWTPGVNRPATKASTKSPSRGSGAVTVDGILSWIRQNIDGPVSKEQWTELARMYVDAGIGNNDVDEDKIVDLLKKLSGKKSGIKSPLREAIKGIRQERANSKAAENQASVQNLSDVADFAVCVQGHPKQVFAQVAKGLVEKNNKDPKYFLMPDGQVHFFRPNDEGDQFFLEPTNGYDWRAELVASCFFYELQGDKEIPVTCPEFLSSMLLAKQHRHLWPPVERIATSPIFSKDGVIVTYKGYNAGPKTLF